MWRFYDLWLELLGEVGMGHWSPVDCNIYDMFCVLLVLHVVCLCLGIAIVVVILSMLRYFLQGTIKRKGTTTLPPGSSGLPFLGETLELFYASKANKVLEDFLDPHVAKYGQVHTLLITQISFKKVFVSILIKYFKTVRCCYWCVW